MCCRAAGNVNYAFAEITSSEIERLIREVAADEADAIIVVCTNMRAAPLVDRLEEEAGHTYHRFIGCLRLEGVTPRRHQYGSDYGLGAPIFTLGGKHTEAFKIANENARGAGKYCRSLDQR